MILNLSYPSNVSLQTSILTPYFSFNKTGNSASCCFSLLLMAKFIPSQFNFRHELARRVGEGVERSGAARPGPPAAEAWRVAGK